MVYPGTLSTKGDLNYPLRVARVNHGSVLTRADGSFELEMAQIIPNFGQPHAHLAYDDGAFQTVFLRPVMPSARDTSVSADFVLAPA
jgi:hypothetical protein